ncbi:MAG: hypothetical protein HQ483_02715 [Rhodospirillales bacterium]|nr:hypothetical protein [Rhodospirillales bacterium]
MGQSAFRTCLMVLLITTAGFLLSRQSLAAPSCTCRYAGQSFQINSCVCITTSAVSPQMACCGMVVNNPSWTFTKSPCPTAEQQLKSAQPVEIAQTPAPLGADAYLLIDRKDK